jgi:hypothetical protein
MASESTETTSIVFGVSGVFGGHFFDRAPR